VDLWSIVTGAPECMFAKSSIHWKDLIELWIEVTETSVRALGVSLEHR
jgi:hypothetical protein